VAEPASGSALLAAADEDLQQRALPVDQDQVPDAVLPFGAQEDLPGITREARADETLWTLPTGGEALELRTGVSTFSTPQ